MSRVKDYFIGIEEQQDMTKPSKSELKRLKRKKIEESKGQNDIMMSNFASTAIESFLLSKGYL